MIWHNNPGVGVVPTEDPCGFPFGVDRQNPRAQGRGVAAALKGRSATSSTSAGQEFKILQRIFFGNCIARRTAILDVEFDSLPNVS